MTDGLLTVLQIAKIRQRSKWTVYRWIRDGYLSPEKTVFGRHYINPRELDKLPEEIQIRKKSNGCVDR